MVAERVNPLSPSHPAGPLQLQQPILLPSVGPCAAFAAMHQLSPSNPEAPLTLALTAVTVGVFAPDKSASCRTAVVGVGVLMTVAVGRSGSITADCSGRQVLSCQAAVTLGSKLSLAYSKAPTQMTPAAPTSHLTQSASRVLAEALGGYADHCSDASGLGHFARHGDADGYAMDPEDLEASAQLAAGGPRVLLATADGFRASPGRQAADQQQSWLAGCAEPLMATQVG